MHRSFKKLLIMSIYGPSPLNADWYMLQKKFIRKTSSIEYDFKLILNNVREDIFLKEDILFKNKKNIKHPAALVQMIEYMRSVHDDYSDFLILDSDCFPVRPGWHMILDQQMEKFEKTLAAPIRYENLDTFPHPCAVYMHNEGLMNSGLDFSYQKVKNLLGYEIDEVGGAMPLIQDTVLPLLRSNRINIHPVAAGIYHHLFYHHAAGSRGFDFRLIKDYHYADHWIDRASHGQLGKEVMQLLIDNPDGFIDKLMYGY